MKDVVNRWAPVLVWAGTIFALSSIPSLEVTHEPIGNFLTRKAAHLGEYALLFLLIFRAQGYQKPARAAVLTILYSVTDELHQSLVPTREPKLIDVLFDAGGAIIGVAIWKYFLIRHPKLKI